MDTGHQLASIDSSKRFRVFKRDNFTCQYCGAKAPHVVLEVDHIHPVSKGGTNDIKNLITSCHTCNRGKKSMLLSDPVSAPIDPKKLYTFYEIVRDGLIPHIQSYQQMKSFAGADKLTNKYLDAVLVKRGTSGVQYQILGANIIKYLAQVESIKSK